MAIRLSLALRESASSGAYCAKSDPNPSAPVIWPEMTPAVFKAFENTFAGFFDSVLFKNLSPLF